MNLTYKLFTKLSEEDKILKKALTNILGYKPSYMPFYVAALTHKSFNSENITNNERLEFLGDAYIGSVVGEYLFMKYPAEDEGFLTEMRSKIVSRQSLNNIALKMGLHKLVRYNNHDRLLGRSHIFGNALEALVGAIFLDKGFKTTSHFLKTKLIGTYVDVDELEVTEFNFKNKLYTWAQKHAYQLDFNTVDESYQAGRKVFKVAIDVNGKFFIDATGYTKKQASQTAAQKALEFLEINPDTVFETNKSESAPEVTTEHEAPATLVIENPVEITETIAEVKQIPEVEPTAEIITEFPTNSTVVEALPNNIALDLPTNITTYSSETETEEKDIKQENNKETSANTDIKPNPEVEA